MKNPVVHDFVVLLYTYELIVPEPTKGKAFTELHNFYEVRMKKHKRERIPISKVIDDPGLDVRGLACFFHIKRVTEYKLMGFLLKMLAPLM